MMTGAVVQIRERRCVLQLVQVVLCCVLSVTAFVCLEFVCCYFLLISQNVGLPDEHWAVLGITAQRMQTG